MVDALDIVLIVWETFVVLLVIVVAFPDARETCYSKGTKTDDICSSEVINVRSYPSTIVELEKMVACFMVSTHENGQIGSRPLAAVVFIEIANLTEFERDGHAIQIIGVSDCLRMLLSNKNSNAILSIKST